MELVVFMGLQASGKSTFFKQKFYDTHIRINLDMLKTRHREQILTEACIMAKQSFVIDNTNPTQKDRNRYIPLAKEAGFRIIGYFFEGDVTQCLKYNSQRLGKSKIPAVAIYATAKKIQFPLFEEGFDELYSVQMSGKNEFMIREYKENEI